MRSKQDRDTVAQQTAESEASRLGIGYDDAYLGLMRRDSRHTPTAIARFHQALDPAAYDASPSDPVGAVSKADREEPVTLRDRAWAELVAATELDEAHPDFPVALDRVLASDRGRALYTLYGHPRADLAPHEFAKRFPANWDSPPASPGVLVRKFFWDER